MPLRRLYAFAGRWPKPDRDEPIAFSVPALSHQDTLFALDRLETTDEGKILFLEENQAVWNCRTLADGSDPPVWCYGDHVDEEEKWFTGEKLVCKRKTRADHRDPPVRATLEPRGPIGWLGSVAILAALHFRCCRGPRRDLRLFRPLRNADEHGQRRGRLRGKSVGHVSSEGAIGGCAGQVPTRRGVCHGPVSACPQEGSQDQHGPSATVRKRVAAVNEPGSAEGGRRHSSGKWLERRDRRTGDVAFRTAPHGRQRLAVVPGLVRSRILCEPRGNPAKPNKPEAWKGQE